MFWFMTFSKASFVVFKPTVSSGRQIWEYFRLRRLTEVLSLDSCKLLVFLLIIMLKQFEIIWKLKLKVFLSVFGRNEVHMKEMFVSSVIKNCSSSIIQLKQQLFTTIHPELILHGPMPKINEKTEQQWKRGLWFWYLRKLFRFEETREVTCEHYEWSTGESRITIEKLGHFGVVE